MDHYNSIPHYFYLEFWVQYVNCIQWTLHARSVLFNDTICSHYIASGRCNGFQKFFKRFMKTNVKPFIYVWIEFIQELQLSMALFSIHNFSFPVYFTCAISLTSTANESIFFFISRFSSSVCSSVCSSFVHVLVLQTEFKGCYNVIIWSATLKLCIRVSLSVSEEKATKLIQM